MYEENNNTKINISDGYQISDYLIADIQDNVAITYDKHSYGLAALNTKNGKLCDIVKPKYKRIEPFENGYAVCYCQHQLGRNCGLINIKGEEIIKPIYSLIEKHSSCLIATNFDGQDILYDYQGNQLFDDNHIYNHYLNYNSKDLYWFFDVIQSCVVDSTGKTIVKGHILDVEPIVNYIKVKKDKWGIIDKDKIIILDCIYDDISLIDEDIFMISKQVKKPLTKPRDQYGLYTNNQLIKPQYKDIKIINKERFLVTDFNNHLKIIDNIGKTIKKIPKTYQFKYIIDDYLFFKEDGRSIITTCDGMDLIIYFGNRNKENLSIDHLLAMEYILSNFDSVEKVNDVYITYKNGKSGVYFPKTKIITGCLWDKVCVKDKLIIYCVEDKMGIVNLDGQIITDPIFDYVWHTSIKDNIVSVETENQIGLLNLDGYYVIEPFEKLTNHITNFIINDHLVLIKTMYNYYYLFCDSKLIYSGNDYQFINLLDNGNIIFDNILINYKDIKYENIDEESKPYIKIIK